MPEPENPQGHDSGTTTPETERLRAEIAFLNKKLQLVGSITRHDVLNQLTAVMGYNELLAMMVQDEKQKVFLAKERQAIEKIRRQFYFAKDYQNLAAEPPRWQHVGKALRIITEEFDPAPVRLSVSTEDLAVLADPLLPRAFLQLIENTVRHSGGATAISISAEYDGSTACIVVTDNGSGIPAADKERIFERGYGSGTGWGLFLTREILAITGITIRENGEPGKGARFVILLPAGTWRRGPAE